MDRYKYRPLIFYLIVFTLTWLFWISAIFLDNNTALVFMTLGLFVPPIVAAIMVFTSKNKQLKDDYKQKLTGFYRLNPRNILSSIALFVAIVAASIGISLLFGGSPKQFALVEGFSFSIRGSSALLTILLASVVEELGWRGYGEDAIANYCTWFRESIIFGLVWSSWHIPLFFIEGTYHYSLTQLGVLYVVNFLISVVPLGFITTWVYVKNNRSMLACIIFHLFVNLMQEKISMTPETKCIETLVVTLTAIIIIIRNQEMFFEKTHIGNILSTNKETPCA